MTGSGGGQANAIVIEDEDDDFISLVAAAEAKALLGGGGNKRLKAESSPEKEGSYLAALRGSKSSQWQQSQQKIQNPGDRAASVGARVSSGGGPGSCYKCGEPGHWARDCGVGGEGGGSVVPDKECRCGVGVCLVLTSNTAKNPGRKFYRCPLKEENGGCSFFEWCDYQPAGTPFVCQALPGSVVPLIPEMQCPCNFGTCLVLTARTGKNAGQQYYRCPNQGQSCGFFKWCNHQNSAVDQHSIVNNSSSQYASGRSSFGCFKCGQDGHWSRDCTMSSSASYADSGETISASSGTCFKCGKPGHWARDCLDQAQASTSERKFSGSSNSVFTHNHK